MPTQFLNPPGIHDPGGRYAHSALITDAKRRLVISGQVGLAVDGTVPEDPAAQVRQALANVGAILDAQGMAVGHVAKVVVYLTDAAHIPTWRTERAAFFGSHVPCSTLLIVAGLADPRFIVEVEIEAVD